MKTLLFALIFSVSGSATAEQTVEACNGLYQHLKFESSANGFKKAFKGSNTKGEVCHLKVMINSEHSCAVFIAPQEANMKALYLHYSAKFPVLNIREGSLSMIAHNDSYDTGPIVNIPSGRHREILTLEADEDFIKVQIERKSGFRLRRTEYAYDCTARLDFDN